MATGRVKVFDGRKGFGFIACDDGKEVFVHQSGIVGKDRQLQKGDLVEFDLVQSLCGWNARWVRRIMSIEQRQMF